MFNKGRYNVFEEIIIFVLAVILLEMLLLGVYGGEN